MLYNSNFDDNWRELNHTIDDPCAIQQRNSDNNKKLKYMTTNHIDLLEGKEKINFFGMTTKDKLFVPAESIDQYSSLRLGGTGNQLTNMKVRHGFGQLPLPTMPSRYQLFHGDVDIEDSLRLMTETNRKACNPKDSDFTSRQFYIFHDDLGIETPDPSKMVENGPRGGAPTRFDKRGN